MKFRLRKISRRIKLFLANVVLGLISLFLVLPLPWLVLSSLDSEAKPFYSIPNLTFQNYEKMLTDPYIQRAFMNSLLISVGTSIISTLVCAMSAYALSRLQIRGKHFLIYSTLLLMVLPFTALMVPIYTFFLTLRLTNTYLGVILVASAFEIPFCTWIMKGYIDTIPKEIEESAWLDGCSRMTSIFRIILPMARRGLVVVAIISFTAAWNEFMIPLILLSSNNKFPASVVLSNFVRRGGAHRSVLKYSIGDLAAFVILYILPTIILAIISRKSLLKIVGSGVKL